MTRSVFTANYDKFRQMLVDARTSIGVTQVELAQKLDRPQSYVSKFERRERRLDVVELLEVLKALGLDSVEFITRLNGDA